MKKTIIMHNDEVPSVKDLIDTISRLKKDYGLLSKIRGKKDLEDPESFRVVISFLESFLKKNKRKLNKESESETKDILKVSMELLLNIAQDNPELTQEVVQEINFIERSNNETKSDNN